MMPHRAAIGHHTPMMVSTSAGILHTFRARPRSLSKVTDRYVDTFASTHTTTSPSSKPTSKWLNQAAFKVLVPLAAEEQQPRAEQQQSGAGFRLTGLDPDSLACVLSWLLPEDLAAVAIAGRCMQDLVLHATDVRASHLGFSLAPFRGLSRLQFLHTKEQAARRASEAEQTTRGTLEDLELHLYYNAPYGSWMPFSARDSRADPDRWASDNGFRRLHPALGTPRALHAHA